ncbi:MAG: nucleotidyltransferase family protein [Candidatus Woesearchaeota archaeon]
MLQKSNLWKITSVFFNEPDKGFGLLKISGKTDLAHTSVKNHLETLEELGIIEKAENEISQKPRFYYRAKRRSEDFLHHKKIYNIDILKKSGVIDHIKENCYPNSIVLFGSFFRGEDNSESDIDIFVECAQKKIDLTRFEFQVNRKISLMFRKDFKKLPEELKNNIMNGIVLYGFLEGFDAREYNTRSEQDKISKEDG